MKQTFKQLLSEGKLDNASPQTKEELVNESVKAADKEIDKVIKHLEKVNYNMKEPVNVKSNGLFELMFGLTDAKSVKSYAEEAADNSMTDDGDIDFDLRDDWDEIADNAQKVADYNQAQMKIADIIKAIKSVK